MTTFKKKKKKWFVVVLLVWVIIWLHYFFLFNNCLYYLFGHSQSVHALKYIYYKYIDYWMLSKKKKNTILSKKIIITTSNLSELYFFFFSLHNYFLLKQKKKKVNLYPYGDIASVTPFFFFAGYWFCPYTSFFFLKNIVVLSFQIGTFIFIFIYNSIVMIMGEKWFKPNSTKLQISQYYFIFIFLNERNFLNIALNYFLFFWETSGFLLILNSSFVPTMNIYI